MTRCSDPEPAKLLWPILEESTGHSSQPNYVLQEKEEFIDITTNFFGNINFPYSPNSGTYNQAINRKRLYLTNSQFWTSFSQCTDAYFVDKYMGEDKSWKLICIMLDYLEKQYRQTPKNITLFVNQNYVASTKSEFLGDIKNSKINDINPDIIAIPEYVHDRFALFDTQLWHCGASAAGSHHKLNAISGPWPDQNERFKNFLLNEIQNAHRRAPNHV